MQPTAAVNVLSINDKFAVLAMSEQFAVLAMSEQFAVLGSGCLPYAFIINYGFLRIPTMWKLRCQEGHPVDMELNSS